MGRFINSKPRTSLRPETDIYKLIPKSSLPSALIAHSHWNKCSNGSAGLEANIRVDAGDLLGICFVVRQDYTNGNLHLY